MEEVYINSQSALYTLKLDSIEVYMLIYNYSTNPILSTLENKVGDTIQITKTSSGLETNITLESDFNGAESSLIIKSLNKTLFPQLYGISVDSENKLKFMILNVDDDDGRRENSIVGVIIHGNFKELIQIEDEVTFTITEFSFSSTDNCKSI